MDYVRDVVVYVPGILGTEIKWTFGSIWRLWPTILPSDVKRLFLDDNGLPEQNSNGDYLTTPGNVFESFLFGDFKVDQTENFLTSLREAGVQVVKAPYDWRLDLGEAKSAVDSAINDAVDYANGQDITLISHSAGGLVARNYLIDNPNAKVKNFINIASPTLGAPRAMKGLVVGDDLGVSEEHFGIKFPIDDETGKSLSQNMTSIYQFLPGKRFVDIYNKIYSSNNSVTYRTFYKDSSQYIENYIDTERYISDNHNAQLYSNARSFREKIETIPISNRFNEHRIVGFGYNTIIRVDKTYTREDPHGSKSRVVEKYKLHTGTGDGVVPVRSADFNQSASANIYYLNDQHVKLLENEDTELIVKQVIFGNQITKSYPLTKSLAGFQLDANCPVHIYVVDNHGNTAGLNEEGILVNNIPNLSYDIWGETKSLFIPTDLNVQIRIEGYDTGFMDIGFTKYEADFPTKTNVLQKINIEPNTKLEFDLEGSTNEVFICRTFLNSTYVHGGFGQ